MARVSVLMPVFNTAGYLKEAVESVLAQTFTDFEFIILDDCSPDNACEILDGYSDPRIIRYRGECHAGLADILNVGLDMAHGEYIARMDSDDISLPERLRIQVEYLDTHAEVDLCSCGMKLFGKRDDVWIRESDPEFVKVTALFYSPVLHASCMWRRGSFEDVGLRYDQSMVPAEDYDLWTRALICGLKLVNIPDVLYLYRIRDSQATEDMESISCRQRIVKQRFYHDAFGTDCSRLIEELTDDNLRTVRSAVEELLRLNVRNGFFGERPLRKRCRGVYQSRVLSDLSDHFSFSSLAHLSARNLVKYLFWDYRHRLPRISDQRMAGRICEHVPRVTVVMPVFNGEIYIREAIESVLAQTFGDFILLVVNDGSTDSSMSIVRSYQDSRIRIIENDGNQGLVKSLNRAVALIGTEYIARMDCDDIWSSEKLSRQVGILDRMPDVGICGTCMQCTGAKNHIQMFPESHEQIKVGMLFHCMICHPSVMFRSSFLKSSGLKYDGEFFPAEDYRMWTEAVMRTKLYNIQEVLIKYRVHSSQVSTVMRTKQELMVKKIRESQLLALYPDCPAEDSSFHINRFASLDIFSEDDIRSFRRWAKILFQKNRESRYIAPDVLEHELWNYVHAATKEYLQRKENKPGIRAALSFVISANWRYLDLRRNFSHIKYLIVSHHN